MMLVLVGIILAVMLMVLARIAFICWDSRYEVRGFRRRLLFWCLVQTALFFGAYSLFAVQA